MNRKKTFIPLVIIFAAALIFMAFGSQNSSEHKVLFEKAKFTMETKGDLKGAIKLFEEIIQKYPDQRGYAALSQYYIGLCFEKRGQNQSKQAQKAFQKVVDNYPEQSQIVQMAREKLIVLFRAQTFIEQGNKSFRIQKIGSEGILGAPSPDGRYFSYVEWENGYGNLAVMEMKTGAKRRLTHRTLGDESWYFVDNSVFSPDGKKLAFTRWKDDDSGELCIINADGSGEHTLLSSQDYYFWLDEWTTDGKFILGVLQKEEDNACQVVLISVSNTDVRIIKELGPIEPRSMHLSSHGRWIAYDYPQTEDTEKRDIFLLSSDGSHEIPLLEHPADDRLLGWTWDGDMLFFSSDRSGTWDAWIIPVENGKTLGDPRLVKRNIGRVGDRGIIPLGFTQNGSFYYGLRTHLQDVYIATIDMEEIKLIAPPKKAILRFEGANSEPNWSPDGKHIAYISRRDPDFPSPVICIQAVGNKEALELSPDLENFGRMSWFPDGKSLLVSGRNKYVHGLHKVDARTGKVSSIVPGAGRAGFHSPRISPDKKYAFYESDSWEEGVFRIMRYNLETKHEKEIYRSEWQILEMDISPDGKWVTFWESADDSIKIIPAEGGQPQVLLELEPGVGITYVTWHPDGKHIFFSKVGRREGQRWRCELWQISREGGRPTKYPLEADRIGNISFHPDGQQIAFYSANIKEEVWVMENFLPSKNAQTESEESKTR